MRPGPTTFALLILAVVLGLAHALLAWTDALASYPTLATSLSNAWWGVWLVLGGLLLADGLPRLRPCPLQVQRQINDNLALNNWARVTLQLSNPGKRAQRLQLLDHYPSHGEVRNALHQVTLLSGATGACHYDFRPRRRGPARFPQVDLLIDSPWRLWRFQYRLPLASETRVYPDFRAVSRYAMLAMEQQTGQLGIRKQQRRGEGLEFHQLREFRQGDSLRQINWNTSARLRKLISKEYQEETDQQVMILLDCGRTMRSVDHGLSHFDHALNAVLLLSHVALRQGDAVGMMSFSGDPRWLPPRKGIGCAAQMLNHIYDLESTRKASDYLQAAQHFMQRRQKRSLIVLMTNVRTEYGDELVPALRLLQRRHLVLLVNLEEAFLEAQREQPAIDMESALHYCGVLNYLHDKRQLQQQLHQQGVLCVNSTATHLPARLINQYFDIKRKGLL